MPPNKLKLTTEQERQFEEDGFFLVEDALSPQEIAELLAVIDELYERYQRERKLGPHDPFQMRNIVALHPVFKKIMDHPGMLPLAVDLMGFNIQLRTSHLDVRPPQPASVAKKELGSAESFFPWHADQPMPCSQSRATGGPRTRTSRSRLGWRSSGKGGQNRENHL